MKRAAEILGERDLAIHLGVSDRELKFWLDGFALPPDGVFLRVVDILSELDLQELKNSRPVTPTPGDDSKSAPNRQDD